MEDFERMYNEAHEAAEKIHRFSSDPKEIKRMEELFPDLKMSEDERMRRNLIRIFKAYQNSQTHINPDMWEGLEIKKILEWLEKKKKDCSWPENVSNCKHNCKICFAKCLYRKEEATMMVQWKGHNLKEVVDFTGLYEKFDYWFGSWEEYEAYVHSHNDIFKIFCKDGSHYEVPVGAWIIRTPEGYNVPSCFVFKPKKSENDERLRDTTIAFLEEFKAKGYENAVECIDWLSSQVLEWNPVCSEIYIEEPVLVQKKNKSDQFGGYIVCCDHTLTPDLYERYLKLSDVKSKSKPVDLEKELESWLGDREGKWKGEECENMCRYFFELGLNAQQK